MESEQALLQKAVEAFESRFGRPPRYAAVTPGRVNLIGEHTDYNDGYVLPMAIDRWAVIVADRTPDRSTLWAVDLDETVTTDLAAPRAASAGSFANHLLGVADQLRSKRPVPQLDLALTSTIPIGSGLASSAAVEVAMAVLLQEIAGIELDAVATALLCQRAEHEFVGTPCGLMDMLVTTLARPSQALLIDCGRRSTRGIPLPPPDEVSVLIADTGVRHDLAQGAYAKRRAGCQRAAEALGLASLRAGRLADLTRAGLEDEQQRLARHVISENERTLLAAAALATNDLEALGELMFDSHASLRDLFAVSCPELDAIVEAAAERRGGSGVIGARMTGAGFGGCAVVLCRCAAADEITSHLAARFEQRFNRAPAVSAVRAVGAARSVALPAP